MKRSTLIILLVIAAGFTTGIIYASFALKTTVSPTVSNSTNVTPKTSTPPAQPPPKETKTIPQRVVLGVPFYAQAPFSIWDSIHKEACEEASLLMVRDYFRRASADLEEQDQMIISFIRWQTANGYKYDLTLRQLAQAAERFYQFSGAKIVDDPTIEEMKEFIADGQPIIAPAAGQLLDNPNFLTPGPIYHMVVIKGYDQKGFITNDPGTRNGEGFRYTYENLYSAIHDWNPADITKGAKRILVYDR